jgi:polyisoprenoid-binding protein YceI
MATTNWVLDPTHSEVNFKIKHLMITNVSGNFGNLSGTVTAEGNDFSQAQVNFTADTATVNTNNPDRDNHLKSGDFFDAEQYPQIKFVSNSYNAGAGTITGDLTIKDVTQPVTLDVDFNGVNKDPWGNQKAGFSLSGKINRKDFGLNWNAALETGGVLVSEEVKISAEVQFVQQG